MSLVACECLPSPGLEPEPCSRARSQARVYLEQIRNRVALGVPDMTKRDYLVDAATQIRLALERDVSEDYEAAFNHYQNGVDVLLRGIHVDPNKERREAVKLKITKYLRRAEEIFNCHLQRPLSSGASPSAGFSSLRLRPIRTLSSAVEQLRGCRVVGVIEKRDLAVLPRLVSNSLPQVQLVQDPATGGTFVVKSLPRCHMVSRERLTIIPHGVPYMTKLLRYFVSEDSIFLHLEHVQGGTLWSHLLSQAHSRHSGLSSGSTQERMKAQLNPHLNLLTPARLPSGHVPGQDRIALEPPRTSPNLLLAGEAPSTRPQREAEGEPTARTSTSGSSDLPKAPGGHLHLQARRAGQNSDAGPPRGLTWVPEGASPVLGGCGRGMDQSCLSADGAGRGCGRATWSVREEQVKQWAAEMLVALEALHEQGVLCRDLHPGNLLLDQAEVGGISELTEACDWWSFGSLLYELLTGMALSQSHPSGIQAHTQLQLPEWLSRPAASLLTELLQFEPTRRLGMGEGGVSKLKSHPFFSTIHWSKLVG
ncbi:ribosomal protein S6 kinase-like 1 isoform X4 [Pan paniscus]|uniref:ribosomal protein S6 kinase-like 1 isoform X4 n=1 Tax=Pan troglodytes TaxID=9598 RepID=UPI0007DB9C87|nr:ribosomal protein S6 kinase-like 1 isoform X4 [Pan troglodytes]XP_054953845.1 ribosomal protein S6 kinase-like 1 isoform X4 [Pan paniscus]